MKLQFAKDEASWGKLAPKTLQLCGVAEKEWLLPAIGFVWTLGGSAARCMARSWTGKS
jgi:hypothetical protein